jgi:hypothetical protein
MDSFCGYCSGFIYRAPICYDRSKQPKYEKELEQDFLALPLAPTHPQHSPFRIQEPQLPFRQLRSIVFPA